MWLTLGAVAVVVVVLAGRSLIRRFNYWDFNGL